METEFIQKFVERVSKHPKIGVQGAITLKQDAWDVVLLHMLSKKGLLDVAEFNDLLKQQLDAFEEMISKEQFKTEE